jgi:hypothetical protein
MEKQITIVVPNASGEEGLTQSCRRGELFRNNHKIDSLYKQGYFIHHYSILPDKSTGNEANPSIHLAVSLNKP